MAAVETIERTNSLLAAGEAVYAARQSGLYRIGASGDERNLYESWLPDQDLPTLAIATAGNLLLAGINGGVARSENGGRNWEARQFRAPAPLVTCLALSSKFAADGCALAGTLEDGAFRSTDGGETWRAVNHGLFDHSIYALALSPHFAVDGIAYVGAGSGIYRSENGGPPLVGFDHARWRRNGAEPGAGEERRALCRLRGAWSAALERRGRKLGYAAGDRRRGERRVADG